MTAEHGSRIKFFGTPVDLLSKQETLAIVHQAMRDRKPVRHTALNVAKLIKLEKDRLLAEDVRGSDIVGIDGMGIVAGLRLFGVRDAERVAGVDLFYDILAMCAREGFKPFILGARQEVLEKAMQEAKERYPGLQFAGARNGYFTPAEEQDVVDTIKAAQPDCLFVAMPTPRKERFLNAHAAKLGVPFVMGVGGSVDVLAGHVSRAPQWMQRNGLEWFHRLVKEPRKMMWRYTSTNAAYAALLSKAKLTGRQPVERS